MPVIIITGYATVESAVEAMKRGADDFLPKPFKPETLRIIVERAVGRTSVLRENAFLKRVLDNEPETHTIIGHSKEIQNVRELIRRVGPTDSTVLISGESGTGKELVARAVHRHSRRADEPFMVVDCCTLVGTLFESELFGHVKGAFTGADKTTRGCMELADGGTVFLDEIGNISRQTQAKLLRVIQERAFMRVGSARTMRVDVRFVAATNDDLLKATEDGTFREDLYYRLSVVPLIVPPLRHHREDIPELARFFTRRYARERKKNVSSISPKALKVLKYGDWPGNVRELENAIERAVIFAESDTIQAADLLQYDYRYERAVQAAAASELDDVLTLADMEKRHIQHVMEHVDGNRGEAARRLGIDRKTLWRKIKKYDIPAVRR